MIDRSNSAAEANFALSDVQSIIAIAATAATAASVIFDWAYFHRVGVSQAGFTTFSDVVASAINWIPPAVLWIYVGSFFGIITVPAGKPAGPHQYGLFDGRPQNYAVFGVLAVGTLIGLLLRPVSDWHYLLWVFIFVWLGFPTFFGFREMARRFGAAGGFIAYLLPACAAAIFVAGISTATTDLTRTDFQTELRLLGDPGTLHIIPFRFTERGVLYRRESDRVITFSTWDQIAQMSYASNGLETRSLSCIWFGFMCPNLQRATPGTVAPGAMTP